MRIEPAAVARRRVSLTPLIDVIFLLLLFFMLSSTFARFSEIEVSGGGRASASAPGERPDVMIRLDGERWRINGADVGADAVAEELARLVEAGAESAVLLVRGEMRSQELVEAVERIRQQPDLRLSIAR